MIINKFLEWLIESSILAHKKNILSLTEKNPLAYLLDLGCDDGKWTKKIAKEINTQHIYGIDIYSSTQCPAANTNADRVGALISTGDNAPIAMVVKKTVGTALQRDESLRATEVVTVSDYGVGEIEDLAGVAIITDHE